MDKNGPRAEARGAALFSWFWWRWVGGVGVIFGVVLSEGGHLIRWGLGGLVGVVGQALVYLAKDLR